MRSSVRNIRGQALIEMALVLPILLALVLGIVEFGFLFSTRINMNNVVRQAVRTAVVSSLSESDLEDDMMADAQSVGMLEDNIKECDINIGDPNVIATLRYDAPLITGYIFDVPTIELRARATMKAE